MIDPETLAGLPIEARERIAYQLMADAAYQAAGVLGPTHPHSCALDEIGSLYDQRPSLRAVAPSGSPSPDRSGNLPILRLLPPLG